MEKIVVSKSGATANWRNSRRVENLDAQTLIDLTAEAGNDLVVYGSLSVVNALTRLGLVDEYHLLIHPTFLGDGKPLLTDQQGPLSLALVSAHSFRSGVVLTKFRSTGSKQDSAIGEAR